MTTSDKLQQTDLFPMELELMSSQGDSPAKTSHLQGIKQVLKASGADSGQSAPVFLGRFDPGTPSLKTSQTCFLENGEIGLSEFSGTFPRSGMMRSGTVYQLPRLAPTITEIGSGLWPTPLAQEAKHGAPSEWEMTTNHAGTKDSLRVQVNKRAFYWRTPDTGNGGTPKAFLEGETHRQSGHAIQVRLSDQVKMWPTPTTQEIEHPDAKLTKTGRRLSKDGKSSHSLNLADQVRMWPTPTSNQPGEGELLEKLVTKEGNPAQPNQRAYNPKTGKHTQITLNRAVKMWPTPSTRDYKGGYIGGRIRNGKVSWDNLDVAVQHTDNQEKINGTLNPTWVEWLMGFPIDHTDLNA